MSCIEKFVDSSLPNLFPLFFFVLFLLFSFLFFFLLGLGAVTLINSCLLNLLVHFLKKKKKNPIEFRIVLND